jgi:hypothetical protein
MFELTDEEMEMCSRIVDNAVDTAVSKLIAAKRGEEMEVDKEVRCFMIQELHLPIQSMVVTSASLLPRFWRPRQSSYNLILFARPISSMFPTLQPFGATYV